MSGFAGRECMFTGVTNAALLLGTSAATKAWPGGCCWIMCLFRLEQVFPIRCQERPDNAALAYEAIIRKSTRQDSPRFDLIFLGLGEDGHTASMFPFALAVDEKVRLVREVYVTAEGLYRVTLTAPVINNARMIAFLVVGRVRRRLCGILYAGPQDYRRFPAQLIRPGKGELKWLVDREAAALIG